MPRRQKGLHAVAEVGASRGHAGPGPDTSGRVSMQALVLKESHVLCSDCPRFFSVTKKRDFSRKFASRFTFFQRPETVNS